MLGWKGDAVHGIAASRGCIAPDADIETEFLIRFKKQSEILGNKLTVRGYYISVSSMKKIKRYK